MKRWIVLALVMCLLLVGCKQEKEPSSVVRIPGAIPESERDVVPDEEAGAKMIEDGASSPNGRYHLWMMKDEKSDEADHLIIWDSDDNLIKWWDDIKSVDDPSAVWSHDGSYLAVSRATDTYAKVTVIETDTWTDWDVTLPNGSGIPKYTFLPEEWGTWTEGNVLRLLVGNDGENEKQTAYRCTVQMEEGKLTGTTVYAMEIIADGYDFNDNGIPESVTLEGNAGEESSFWVLRVMEDDKEIWADSAASSHAGWNSIFACEINGDDYLLRYDPYMGQGFATYDYELFFLSESGEELVVMENRVEFDENFGSPIHQSFEAAAIADFLWDVRGYLANSTLLLSTEDGVFQSGGPGTELTSYPFGELMKLEDRAAIEEALRLYEEETKAEMGIS